MQTKISLQCPHLLVFYSFLDILYREGSEMGDPDGDEMFVCGCSRKKSFTTGWKIVSGMLHKYAALSC